MIVEKIYKTEDGHTFNSEKEALEYENNLKLNEEEKSKMKKELDEACAEMKKALDVASDAYIKYEKAYIDYKKKYNDYYKKYNDKKESYLDEFVSELFSILKGE